MLVAALVSKKEMLKGMKMEQEWVHPPDKWGSRLEK